MEYIFHILILISIYSIVSFSLNLVAGYAGLISVTHAGFFGVGAYTVAILSQYLGTNSLFPLLPALVFSSLLGFLVSLLSWRLADDFFVIATLGIQIIIFQLMNNWTKLTNGPLGLPGILRPYLFGNLFSSNSGFFLLAAMLMVITLMITRRLVSSPFGNVLRALREDELFAQSLGKNVNYYKTIAFSLSAGLTAMGGGLYAYYLSYVNPTSFSLPESIFMLSIVIIGGLGSLAGSFIGSIILVSLPELLRALNIPSSIAANIRQILFGGLLITFVMIRPRGILGDFGINKFDEK